MRRALLLVSLALSGCHGCQGAAPPAEEMLLDEPPDAGTRARPLLPEDLDGVLPPRWGVGDEWIIRTNTVETDMFRGNIHRTLLHRFRVTDVPKDGADYYVLTAHGGDRHAYHHYALAFRVPDLSMTEELYVPAASPSPRIDASFTPIPLPHVRGHLPVFAFPSMPPLLDDLPPRFANPISFFEERTENTIRQTIEPTPEGLQIRFEVQQLLSDLRIDMRWRRGDPWWSSVRVWAKSRMDEDAGRDRDETLIAFADLFRPGEQLDPIPLWWPLGEPMPDASDPRYGGDKR